MAIPYPYLSSGSFHFSSGSYLNQQETFLFVNGFDVDLWYGFADTDIIELSVFDLDQNQLDWQTLDSEKEFRTISLSYVDTFNKLVSYSYNELLTDLILFKNEKILVDPAQQISSSFGLGNGSYLVSYNFMREMAGSPTASLLIKDISPSRKELKIIPSGPNDARYQAFCEKQFVIKDVAPLLLQLTTNCPVDQIYAFVAPANQDAINFLKNLLFLQTDGQFTNFLRHLYEDLNTFSSTPTALGSTTQTKRIQGIRTYFQNNLLSNYETISSWDEVGKAFSDFTTYRIQVLFQQYGPQTGADWLNAQQFLHDFFYINFYLPVIQPAHDSFQAKYYSLLKNALNFGNNQLLLILDHTFMDERSVPTDPLTLVVKLKEELPQDIKIQDSCWVSNVSLVPYLFNAILRGVASSQVIQIGPPNFSLESDTLSLSNINQQFSATDLQPTQPDQQAISVSKNITQLKVDYTDFSNFVIYSSAAQRLFNFKNKIQSYYVLSASLVNLNATAAMAAASGSVYPAYSFDANALQGQIATLVNSFDGYESYLFDTGSYAFNPVLGVFINATYVTSQDQAAAAYDQTNLDSLVNMTPDHIVLDDRNDEYLLFLTMIGHFFDNIYLYINNLQSEKLVDNDPTLTFSKKMVDYMLETFGWQLGNTYEDLTLQESFLTSPTSSLSAEDRTKAIRTRLLTTLPQIYKTKGTEEAIRLILACHGIPPEILQIREYGNEDFVTSSIVTYTAPERFNMINFSGSTDPFFGGYSTQIDENFTIRPNPLRTFETKIRIPAKPFYTRMQTVPVASAYNQYGYAWDPDNTIHNNFPWLVPYYQAVGYYPFFQNFPAWELGYWRETENLGRIYAKVPTWKSASFTSESLDFTTVRVFLTSSLLPIFDGDIFSIRLRRNYPDPSYFQSSDENIMPLQYDLTVQRNESGRQVWRSFSSIVGEYETNKVWAGSSIRSQIDVVGDFATRTVGDVLLGANFTEGASSYEFYLGNTMIWDVPISDEDWEVHCNDLNSFAYSGSNGDQHLITRLDTDEALPFNNFLGFFQDGFNFALADIPNASEFYPTFVDLYSQATASGSWTGAKTGSLTYVENFSGSLRGIVSGSMTGEGAGWLLSPNQNWWGGQMTGSMSGTFNGIAIGQITQSYHIYTGWFGAGGWTGSIGAADTISQSYFTGSLSGSISGTFFGTTSGSMFSTTFGNRFGVFTDIWTGQLTGSISGSVRAVTMSGSFLGFGSGSIIGLTETGTLSTFNGIYFGELTGSFIGGFTGSTGFVQITGSSGFSNNFTFTLQRDVFTGSFEGTVTSSGTNGYAVGEFSGSFIQPWTGSDEVLYQKSPMPFEITWLSQNPPFNASSSTEFFACGVTVKETQSVYPYEYEIHTVDKTYTTPKWGPNRLKNEKIKQTFQSLQTRLDSEDRSTEDLTPGIISDSNLIGLYLDPQDAKNRDIIRYMGRWDVVDSFADPGNQFSASYTGLQGLNFAYNSFGNRQVLYNELITLYKFYFNRAIFDNFQNVIPARTSVRRGILIEPTVLERPKYQRKPIFSEIDSGSAFYAEVTASHYFQDPHTKLVRFSGSKVNESSGYLGLLWGNFNIDTSSVGSFNTSSLPANPTIDLNLEYINTPNFIYPQNYERGQYNDLPDDFQLGDYGSLGGPSGFLQAFGFSQVNGGVLVKQWEKHTIYHKTGSYVRDGVQSDDQYLSNSIYLWRLVSVTPQFYTTIFYTASVYILSGSSANQLQNLEAITQPSDILVSAGNVYYFHQINTAVNSDNQSRTGILPTPNRSNPSYVYADDPHFDISGSVYWEVFGGYPNQHYTHRMQVFSPASYPILIGPFATQTQGTFTKCGQTITTTIDDSTGLEDASLPVQSIQVSNINLVKSDNVINQ